MDLCMQPQKGSKFWYGTFTVVEAIPSADVQKLGELIYSASVQ